MDKTRASQQTIPASSSSENSSPESQKTITNVFPNGSSPLVTGRSSKPMKTPKRNRRRSSVSRVSLEQSIHIANFEAATKPNTSIIVEQDEDSEKSDLDETKRKLASSEENGKKLEAKQKESETTRRRKHVNRLWRERRDWKQIRKNVLKMNDEDFINSYCDGKVFCSIDVEKVYEQAEKEVKEFIEKVLSEKYGENVKTLEDRYKFLVEKAKKEAVDLEEEKMIGFANAQIDMMKMMRWKGDMVVEF